jgi:hypothetical protein
MGFQLWPKVPQAVSCHRPRPPAGHTVSSRSASVWIKLLTPQCLPQLALAARYRGPLFLGKAA